MNPVAKMLIITGIILIAAGLVWMMVGRYLHLGRLPGDMVIERDNFKFYFPIATCILISVILSLIAFIVRWLMK